VALSILFSQISPRAISSGIYPELPLPLFLFNEKIKRRHQKPFDFLCISKYREIERSVKREFSLLWHLSLLCFVVLCRLSPLSGIQQK
jgi:hypothetical protein